MKKTTLLFLVSLAVQLQLLAQQDAQYTQYMYNTISVNPAYAGSRGVLSVAGLYRSQWVGLDGAPTTQTFNIQSPVSQRVGLGLSIVNDVIGNGTNQDTYFDGVFSYTIPTSDNGKLSFGLKAGGHLLNIDLNQLRNVTNTGNSGDENFIDKRFSPNFGAGVYYLTNSFYAGLSIPNFFETKHFQNATDGNYLATERMNWYLISGFATDLSTDWTLRPSVLLKMVKGSPLQADFSTNFIYMDKLTLGAAYRWSAAWSALFGYQFNEKLMLGLAYDTEITELGNSTFNNGSFEVFLRFEVLTRFHRVVTATCKCF